MPSLNKHKKIVIKNWDFNLSKEKEKNDATKTSNHIPNGSPANKIIAKIVKTMNNLSFIFEIMIDTMNESFLFILRRCLL